jgi:hypothetical protein
MKMGIRIRASVLGLLLATATANLGGEASAGAWDPRVPAADTAAGAGCCRICTQGKACGNSCISREKQCHQPPGCACDG